MPMGDFNQVFINCPFDEEYKSLLRPLLFTFCYLGFNPRIASEFLNSAETRIDKICNLIRISNYSVHDLSRCKSSSKDEFYRMNMPFEFGIDFGNSYYTQSHKKMLVLEGKRYDYQKALSDLSGVDVKCHNNEPEDVVRCIRDWTIEANILDVSASATILWYNFTDFTWDFFNDRKKNGFTNKDLNDLPSPEYINAIKDWLRKKVGIENIPKN
jgi:hypothetical protein